MNQEFDAKPWIGVTVHVDSGAEEDLYPGHPLTYVERTYLDTLHRHGMKPLILPVLTKRDAMGDYLELLDGLLLTGGGYLRLDVSSRSLPGLRGTARERYDFEMALLEEALPRGMPIMGICRGCQMINEFFGGTLANLPPEGPIDHHQETKGIPGHVPVHAMRLESTSRLRMFLGQSQVMVNSFHRQAISRPGDGLKVAGQSEEDGVIEAIEGEAHPWLIGLQFHPEKLWSSESLWSNLFLSFREAALSYRKEQG
jgi:putative glutamine amidotransferase